MRDENERDRVSAYVCVREKERYAGSERNKTSHLDVSEQIELKLEKEADR